MVQAWLMPDNDLVVSQFERNYVENYSLETLQTVIGVEQYQVSKKNSFPKIKDHCDYY